MTGFPPPPEKLVMQPDSDFFSFPTAANASIDLTSLPAYQAVAEYLIKR